MTLNQLLYFKRLAETSHMRRTADELYISQPSLSAAISKLEEELGVLLFSRRGHQLRLTAEGEALLLHAERVLREADEAKEHMRRLAQRAETHIHMGCIAPALYGYLPEAMSSFLARPGCGSVDFEFSVENNDELIRRLKNGAYELILCAESGEESLVQTKVLSEPLAVVSPAGAPRAPATWEALAAEVRIGCEEGSFLDRMMREISRRYGVAFRLAYRATAEEGIVSLVEHGFGRAIMPWSEALMRKYAVSRDDLPEGKYARDVYLTTLRGREPSGAAARFIRYLTEHAREL